MLSWVARRLRFSKHRRSSSPCAICWTSMGRWLTSLSYRFCGGWALYAVRTCTILCWTCTPAVRYVGAVLLWRRAGAECHPSVMAAWVSEKGRYPSRRRTLGRRSPQLRTAWVRRFGGQGCHHRQRRAAHQRRVKRTPGSLGRGPSERARGRRRCGARGPHLHLSQNGCCS